MPSPLESSTVEPWYIDNPSSKLKFPKKGGKKKLEEKKKSCVFDQFRRNFSTSLTLVRSKFYKFLHFKNSLWRSAQLKKNQIIFILHNGFANSMFRSFTLVLYYI